MDFSLLDAERGLLGESWLVDIELQGKLDYQGMVLDFGDVKKKTKAIIDEYFDHKLLIPIKHPQLSLEKDDHSSQLHFQLNDGSQIIHKSPLDAITPIDSNTISTETVAQAIISQLMTELPDNIEHINIGLYNEDIAGVSYQYSHGLKQHDGNCQRIAHGHRSALHIYRKNIRDMTLEHHWADNWQDIYIGSQADLQSSEDIDGIEYYTFAYTANQGDFELTLPANRCVLIDTDSTVENIAAFIQQKLQAENQFDPIEVHAFEGVDKGAIA